MNEQIKTMSYESCHQMRDILDEVANERKRQFIKWGYQDISPAQFALILGEEVGEVNKEIIETHFEGWSPDQLAELRNELIQVAAVAVQFLQVLDDKVALNKRDLTTSEL
jgi:NTP pyrophosphatase (non-canonical NTP hydrolase)